jgi:ATP-dependent RNA helicase DeaD
VLAPALSRLTPGSGLQAIVVVPDALLAETATVTRRLAAALGLRAVAAHGLGRTEARLREGRAQVLVATPRTLLSLLRRSALPVESILLTALAWPELDPDGATLDAILPELPREAQRLVLASRQIAVDDLVERWARKALVLGAAAEAPVGPVRVVVAPVSRRLHAVAGLVEVLDPDSLGVWVADLEEADRIRSAFAGGDLEIQVGSTSLGPVACVVAYDLPARDQLAHLLTLAREVVVLVPPAAEAWFAGIAAPRRPLQLRGAVEEAAEAAAAARAEVAARIEAGAAGGLLAVSPLLERHDPAMVAGALWELWRSRERAVAPPVPSGQPVGSTMARIWASAGRKDGATPADFVAALTKEVGVDRTSIGRIELRETFSLIEVPAGEAERIARALDGRTVRRRRLTAHVDRGPSAGPGRPKEKR